MGLLGELVAEAVNQPRRELVCLDSDGRPDFARLRRRLTGPATGRHRAVLQVFDLVHLDGRSTRPLPYAERRALLEELALDGAAWRTPASMVLERSQDFVARVAELGLEGVVAKRLSSTYLPGRWCRSWVKYKLRHEERLAVTGIRRTRDGGLEAIFVARHRPDGSFTGAGAVELGLQRELVDQLEHRLARLPARQRGAVSWYPAEVSVVASLHARPTVRRATRCCERCWTPEPVTASIEAFAVARGPL